MLTNISMIRNVLKCPQYAYNQNVALRGPLETPESLEVGTLFHEGMHARLGGQSVSAERLPSWSAVSQDARDTFTKHKLWLPLNAFTVPNDWQVLGAEVALKRAISPRLTLQGRLDGLVVWNGKRWSAQWKTYTDDLLSLQERVRLSFHEVGYQWLAESEGIPWGGTILGACQKLPGYRIIDHRRHEITDQDRVEAFSIHYLTRPPEMQERMVRDLLAAAEKTQWELEGMHIHRNYDSCFGPYGRGKCPYFAVCHESEDLMGPKFKDLEDRYGNDDSSVQKAVEP